jgi:hypothetical protein
MVITVSLLPITLLANAFFHRFSFVSSVSLRRGQTVKKFIFAVPNVLPASTWRSEGEGVREGVRP